jgi:DNA-binding GntR family transcriptional regulator
LSVAEQKFRHDIILGRLPPGKRLSEQALCRNYKFGRGIVRAALVRLAHQGFVSAHARSGWTVASITPVGLREIIIGRVQLEPLLAGVDLAQSDVERIDALCGMHAAILSAPKASADHLALLRGYDREVRALLAARLKAPLIAGWLANLWDRSDFYLNFLEASSAIRLTPPDWSDYVAARRSGNTKHAAAVVGRAVDSFASFARERMFESDLEVPVVRTTRKIAGAQWRADPMTRRASNHRRNGPSK